MKIISKLVGLLRKDQEDVWVQTIESGIRSEDQDNGQSVKSKKIFTLAVFVFLFLTVAVYVVFSSFRTQKSHYLPSDDLTSPTPVFSPTPTSTPKLDVKTYLRESITRLREEVDKLSLEDPSTALPQVHLGIRL